VFETIRVYFWTLRQYGVSRMAPERVYVAQQRRLRRLLRHAGALSPFYREKFKGIDLTRCSLADLPITTKSELMEHFDQVVTDPDVKRADLD